MVFKYVHLLAFAETNKSLVLALLGLSLKLSEISEKLQQKCFADHREAKADLLGVATKADFSGLFFLSNFVSVITSLFTFSKIISVSSFCMLNHI